MAGTPPNRILVIHHRSNPKSGEDDFVDREIRLLRAGGHEIELLEHNSSEIGGFKAKLDAAVNLPYSHAALHELDARIDSFEPDMVHVHGFFPSFTPSIFDSCRDAEIPVVQTVHDYRIFCASGKLLRNGKPCELCLGGNTLHALRHACYQDSRLETFAVTRMIRRHRAENTWNDKVSLFIALSNFSAKKLAEGGIDTEKIKTKPGFAFHQTQEGVRTNSDFALYVGRLSEEKGLRTVLRAWEKLKFPLWIVGDGPLRNEADALKIKNPAVKVLGEMPLESVTRIMAKARFLILPSEFYENFPLVLAEAFSVGLPVVAARIGALAELVYHERNGLLFEPGNSEILATLTTMLFQNDTLSNRLGSAARTTYEQLYTPVANLKRLREIYAMAMENAKA